MKQFKQVCQNEKIDAINKLNAMKNTSNGITENLKILHAVQKDNFLTSVALLFHEWVSQHKRNIKITTRPIFVT